MKKIFLMSFLTVLFSWFGCKSEPQNFPSVDVDEFAALIADTQVVRLDVRTPEEYAAGHIPGALNLNVKDKEFPRLASEQLPQSQRIAVYCRRGSRSKRAATILDSLGYDVVDLDKGFTGWTEAGREVEK